MAVNRCVVLLDLWVLFSYYKRANAPMGLKISASRAAASSFFGQIPSKRGCAIEDVPKRILTVYVYFVAISCSTTIVEGADEGGGRANNHFRQTGAGGLCEWKFNF